MQRKSLGSELGSDLLEKIENPINFKPLVQDLAHGYEASVLVEICKAIKRAADVGRLTGSQAGLVAQANIIIQALAKVGVVALTLLNVKPKKRIFVLQMFAFGRQGCPLCLLA